MLNRVLERSRLAVKLISRRNLDFIEMLEIDHVCVEMYYFLFEWSRGLDESRDLVATIKELLLKHSLVEDTYIYPACERIGELKDRISEAREEHRQMRLLLQELKPFVLDREKLKAQMEGLMEVVRHHVREEENEVFPRVRELMDKTQFQRITELVKRAKQARHKKPEEKLVA